MTAVETLTLAAYFFVLLILAVYGWQRYYLVYIYMKNKERVPLGALRELIYPYPTFHGAVRQALSGLD